MTSKQQEWQERVAKMKANPEKWEQQLAHKRKYAVNYRNKKRRDPAFLEAERIRNRAKYWKQKEAKLKAEKNVLQNAEIPPVSQPIHTPKLKDQCTSNPNSTMQQKLDRIKELETLLDCCTWEDQEVDDPLSREEIKKEDLS